MGKVYTGTVIESLKDEWSLLKDVKMNLREQEKLSDEELTKLDELIQERYERLMDYAKKKHEDKGEALKAERERVIEFIQKAADEASTQQ